MIRLLFLLALVPLLHAGEPVFNWELAQFLATPDSQVVDLDCVVMVQRSSITFKPVADGANGGYAARLTVTQGLATLADTTWERLDHIAVDEVLRPEQKIPDMISLRLPAGKMRLTLTLSDLVTGESRTKSQGTTLLELWRGPSVSDIRLGVSHAEPAQDGPFLRNGMRMVPYADAIYGQGLPVIHGLVETYNVTTADSALWTARVLSEMQSLLFSTRPRLVSEQRTIPGGFLVSFEQDVSELASGSYFLEVMLLDRNQVAQATTRRAVWIHNPGVVREAEEQRMGEYDHFSAEQVEEEWSSVRLLTDMQQQRTWESLDLNGRRDFLANFWMKRDPDPRTLVNEARVQHRLRVEQANARYGRKDQPGYVTDRGRVLVMYGEPAQISRDYNTLITRFNFQLQNELGMDPGESIARDRVNNFELWTYEDKDNSVFIFVDTHGFQQYELVHSTMPGEYIDPRWVRKLYTR